MRKAMIFAAGLGTRLAPLTDNKPKALVELEGKTLLERTVEKLVKSSVQEIVVNIHHFPDLMKEAIKKLDFPGIRFHISDESTELLDTGGGLRKAAEFLDGDNPFIVHNVDVISDIDLDLMYQQHIESGALATLAVCNRQTARYFLWHKGRLCGWQNIQSGSQTVCYPTPKPPIPLAFSGIHIISPSIFNLMSETGIFPINQVYLRLTNTHKIMAYTHDPQYWADLGTTKKLTQARKLLQKYPQKF